MMAAATAAMTAAETARLRLFQRDEVWDISFLLL
jgi:hypothetical protein